MPFDPYRQPQACVYYMAWADQPDAIKIGTTTDLRKRLRALGRAHTLLVVSRVLVAEPGTYNLERSRHHQFRTLRINGSEYFRWCPQLAEHITDLRRKLEWVDAPTVGGIYR